MIPEVQGSEFNCILTLQGIKNDNDADGIKTQCMKGFFILQTGDCFSGLFGYDLLQKKLYLITVHVYCTKLKSTQLLYLPATFQQLIQYAYPMEFRFVIIGNTASSEQKEQLSSFWADHNLIPTQGERDRMLDHVRLAAYDGRGKIVAVSTVFTVKVALLNNNLFYQLRYFSSPDFHDHTLHEKIIHESAHILQVNANDESEKPIGVIILLENNSATPQHLLTTPIWKSIPFVLAGYTKQGQQIRVLYFAGARI